ncbi:MAG: 50S ribosomal protein L1 [Candidatus Nitrosothermus koennekii]|nr:MAG: 50S ribosomal protein L1 [Candidatus Nitrosothermus koennekii]
MVSVSVKELKDMISKARENAEKRKFTQAVELIIALKDIDIKKGFSLNEVITLPHPMTRKPKLCLIATGDLALRAKNAGIDRIIEPEELATIGSNKREAKKLANEYDFFLAETSYMANVGKSLGQVLGPRGKMASPVPFNAPIDAIINRFRSSVRVRLRRQMMIACKIGYEDMSDEQLAENAMAVINAIEGKLPNGDKNIRDIIVKFTMGKPVRLSNLLVKVA